MNTAVNTPAETIIDDLIGRLESGTGKPEDWDEDLRTFKTPVIVCDGTLTILEANKAFFEWSRYDRSLFCRQKLRDIPLSLLSGESVWDSALTRRNSTGIVEMQFPAGPHICRLTALPVNDVNGLLISVLLIMTDHIEEPDLLSYDQIRKSVSDPAEILVQPDGAVLSMSGPAADLLGIQKETHGGINLQNLPLLQEVSRHDLLEILNPMPGDEFTLKMIQSGERSLLFRTQRRTDTILKRPVLHISISKFSSLRREIICFS